MIDFLRELWGFIRTRKRYWLLPVFVMVVLVGALLVAVNGSALAPFIYSVF